MGPKQNPKSNAKNRRQFYFHPKGWGTRVIERLALDLGHAFPEMKGFSIRNLKYMRTFAEAYPEESIVQQAVALIPWGHHVRLLDQVSDPQARIWYIHKTIENGWSRNVLEIQIERELYERQGKATTNFKTHYLQNNPIYLENCSRVRTILSFSMFVDDTDFYIDLLFYHVKSHRYLVIELKSGPFKPEYAGKLNFYLSAVDDLLRSPGDDPTIGLILCKTKSHIVAEYALRDTQKPMGVSTFKLPKALENTLPSVKELEEQLELNENLRQKKSQSKT